MNAIGIRAQTLCNTTESSAAVVGLGCSSFNHLNFVPQMFNRVQIWPVHNNDVILLQEVSCCPGCMCTHIILLERLVLMTCKMRSWNLIDVTGSCYSIASPRAKILEDNWTSFMLCPMPPHTMMLGPPQAFLSIMQLSSYHSPQSCSAICG